MKRDYSEWIFDSVMGNLTSDYRCNAVENFFEEGKLCMELYGQMLDAYERLCSRLPGSDGESDPDAEIMINALLEINRIVGIKMFEYGQLL